MSDASPQAGGSPYPWTGPRGRLAVLACLSLLLWGCSEAGGPSAPAEEAPARLELIAGVAPVAEAGKTLADRVRVRVLGEGGDPIPGAAVRWRIVAGGGQLAAAESVADSLGEASAAWTMGRDAAVNRLEVEVEPLPPVVITTTTWTLAPREVTLATIGDSARPIARFGDQSSTEVSLSLSGSDAWVSGTDVADPAALEHGLLVAAAPGTAEVTARAFDIDMGTVSVRAMPEDPVIVDVHSERAVGEGEPLVVRGYHLEAIAEGDWLVDGLLDRVVIDSATLHLSLQSVETAACAASLPDTLRVTGPATVPEPAELAFRRRTALPRLESTTDGRRLSPEDVQCLVLPAGTYHLAFYDGRYAEPPDTTLEVRYDELTIVGGRAAAEGAAVRRTRISEPLPRSPEAASRDRPPREGPASDSIPFWEITEPWSIGDTIPYDRPQYAPNGLEVVDIVADHFVIAVPIGDPPPAGTPLRVRGAIEYYHEHHRDWYEQTFDVRPRCANGQYLVSVMPRPDPTHERGTGGAVEVVFWLDGTADEEFLYYLWAHELAHGFQGQVNRENIEGYQAIVPRHRYNIEGGAELMSTLVMFDRAGLPFDADLELSDIDVLWHPFGHLGNFEQGYHYAAHFFLHLASRIADSTPLSFRAAADSIARATLYNRYGCLYRLGQLLGCDEHDGIFDVVDRLLGGDFDPALSTLDFILTNSVSDDHPEYQRFDHPHVHVVEPIPPLASWLGEQADEQSMTLTNGYGHYFLLRSDDDRAYQFTATSPRMHWKLLPIR